MRVLLFTKVLILAWLLNACTPSHSGPNGEGGGQDKPKESEELAPYFAHPETIDYQVVREKVLSFPCMKCHDSKSPTKNDEAIDMGADMTDYNSLFEGIAGPALVKGEPDKSFMYYNAVAGPKKNMPPKKSGLPELSEDQIKLMKLWILNCAIESKAALGENDKLIANPENPEKVRECEETPAEEPVVEEAPAD